MKSIYRVYKCKSCKREMILLTEDVDRIINNNRYLTCTYCSCKHLKKVKETDDLIECFRNDEKRR
jgi:DNA-directed RNA polymerase subunit RPC12/RpoP